MVTGTPSQQLSTQQQIVRFFLKIKEQFPTLYLFAVLHLFLFLACLLAIFFDTRELMGINVWIKPAKFLLSTAIFMWTLGWYLSVFPIKTSTKKYLTFGFIILLLIENFVISLQASRGVISHYNISSSFDGRLFMIMGTAIGLLSMLMIYLSIQSFSKKLTVSKPMRWGIRIALLAFLLGSVAGRAMVSQMGHNIGVEDGGEGLPFLNWSTIGGDLRVAHFMGLHALQLIPLSVYFISKRIKSESYAFVLSLSFAILYVFWIVFTYFQAKSGQPLISL